VRARAFAVLVAVGLAGLAASAGASPTTRIVGGTSAERALVRGILASLGSSHLSKLQIVSAAGGVKLRNGDGGLRPAWEVLVVGGTYLERSAALGLPPLLEVDAGSAGWPSSNVGGAQPKRATVASATAARAAILRAATASGARIAELSVSRPYALAVAVRLKVDDAASFLHHRLGAFVLSVRSRASRYEGSFLEVDDAHGAAWTSAESRLGGVESVRPGLRGCNPFPPPGPGPPGGSIPPCPA
jgi:hypothetical protein